MAGKDPVDTMGHPGACKTGGDGVHPGVPALHGHPGPVPVHLDLQRLHRPAQLGVVDAGTGPGHDGHRPLPSRRSAGQQQEVVIAHPPLGHGEQELGDRGDGRAERPVDLPPDGLVTCCPAVRHRLL